MTDTDSSGAQTSPSGQVSSETLSGLELGWREGSRVRRGRGGVLELMVLHLPGSMSIMALITLSKESIILFSFL